jgi:hypothetical protein
MGESTHVHSETSKGSPYSKSDSDSELRAPTEESNGHEGSQSLCEDNTSRRLSMTDGKIMIRLPESKNKEASPCQEDLQNLLQSKRKTMDIMKCPHKNQKHYAKVYYS